MRGNTLETYPAPTHLVMFEGLLATPPEGSVKFTRRLFGKGRERWADFIDEHLIDPLMLAQMRRVKLRLDGPMDLATTYPHAAIDRIEALADRERWPFERVTHVDVDTLRGAIATGRVARVYYGDLPDSLRSLLGLGSAAMQVSLGDSSWR